MTMSIIAISVTKILRLINLSLFSTVLMKFHHIIKTANTQNCSVTISCDWLKGSHFMTQYTGPLFSFPDTGGCNSEKLNIRGKQHSCDGLNSALLFMWQKTNHWRHKLRERLHCVVNVTNDQWKWQQKVNIMSVLYGISILCHRSRLGHSVRMRLQRKCQQSQM